MAPHFIAPPTSSEYQRLQADVDRLRKECARAEGHKLGQEDQVRHLQKELQSDLYSKTEERHIEMVIKLKVRGEERRGGGGRQHCGVPWGNGHYAKGWRRGEVWSSS